MEAANNIQEINVSSSLRSLRMGLARQMVLKRNFPGHAHYKINVIIQKQEEIYC